MDFKFFMNKSKEKNFIETKIYELIFTLTMYKAIWKFLFYIMLFFFNLKNAIYNSLN